MYSSLRKLLLTSGTARWNYDDDPQGIISEAHQQDITQAFTQSLAQVNSGVYHSSEGDEVVGKENPWQREGRKPPLIRMMKMVPDLESALKITIDETEVGGLL